MSRTSIGSPAMSRAAGPRVAGSHSGSAALVEGLRSPTTGDAFSRPGVAPAPPSRGDVLAERAFNVALGLSLLSWAVLRWWHAEPASRTAPVQWTVLAMHACAGVLVLLRAPAHKQGTPAAVLAGLPCFVAGLWMMRLAPPPQAWPLPAAAVFVAAGAWTLASLLTLGRNFAIFPALRGLVTRGPFSLIRHPAYAGETVMLLAAAAARPSLLTAALAVAIFPLLVLRIRAEEQTLAAAPGYARYVNRVRWRLLPGVW